MKKKDYNYGITDSPPLSVIQHLRGFDPGLVQHIMKLARQKQELVNSALEAPFRRELRDFLKVGTFFSIHPEWVSNWESASRITDNIRTCISL